MNLLQSMGVLLSPKTAFSVVHKAVEETLKQKVKNFDVVYRVVTDEGDVQHLIDFIIYNYVDPISNQEYAKKRLKYTNSDFLALVKNMVSSKLDKEKAGSIDYVVFSYSKLDMTVYQTGKDNQKTVKTFKL